LHDSGLAYDCLARIARDFTYSSLLCAVYARRRIYNLDANFGYPTVVMEMLVFSRPGCIEVLPALPADRFPRGRMTGMLCRGQFRMIDLTWDMPKGQIVLRLGATYKTPARKKVLVKFPFAPQSVTCDSKDVALGPSPHGSAYRTLTIPAGAAFTLRVSRRP
jgi:hypothetical protein